MFWNLLGAIGWGLKWIGIGYLSEHSLNLAQIWLSRFGMLLVLLLYLRYILFRYGPMLWQLTLDIGQAIILALRSSAIKQHVRAKHPRFFAFSRNSSTDLTSMAWRRRCSA